MNMPQPDVLDDPLVGTEAQRADERPVPPVSERQQSTTLCMG
jgi:hypothetical protein